MSEDINEHAMTPTGSYSGVAGLLYQSTAADQLSGGGASWVPAAERDAHQARYDAERAEDRMADARREALQLAVAVCGGRDPATVLSAARDFSAFLTGSEQKVP